MRHRLLALTLALAALPACEGALGGPPASPRGPHVIAAEPGPVVVPRLTVEQYRHAVADLLGDGLEAGAVEADTAPFLFTSIGAGRTSFSERGVQQWEEAATAAADLVFADAARREALVGCAVASVDDSCARIFVARFGRRAFRRPLDVSEIERWVAVARTDPDPWRGLSMVVAGMLQSPFFLYRVELGAPDPEHDGWSRLDGFEMASRLAFVLWGTVPDEQLLEAAAAGVLDTPVGVRWEAMRMLDDARSRGAVRAFFREYLGLGGLDSLDRDPVLFPGFDPAIGVSMRGEIERAIDHVVFEEDDDFRAIFDTQTTFLDARLGELYGITIEEEALAAADAQGFARVVLSGHGPRAGLLTMAGVLASNAHPNLTSPTRRGKFVRERLLCEMVADPPPDVPLELGAEEEEGVERTLRERLAEHRENPACAVCHQQLDPIGLGLEDFDAIGAYRESEAGRPVDARGDLDEMEFDGARELGALLRHDRRVPVCVTRQLFRHALGRLDDEHDRGALLALSRSFAESGYRFRELLIELVTSEAFRTVLTPDTSEIGSAAMEEVAR